MVCKLNSPDFHANGYIHIRRVRGLSTFKFVQPNVDSITYVGAIQVNETVIFAHVVSDGNYGVMTHFWATAGSHALDTAVIRYACDIDFFIIIIINCFNSYYVDGEETPSIAFAPPMAAGVGFGETQAPRGTKWIGMGVNDMLCCHQGEINNDRRWWRLQWRGVLQQLLDSVRQEHRHHGAAAKWQLQRILDGLNVELWLVSKNILGPP